MSAALLTGWGRTAPTRADVVAPASADEVAAALAAAGERGVVARGLGRAYNDAAQNAGGAVLVTERLDRILSLDAEAGVVEAEAGVSLDALLRHVLPAGWFVPVTPGTRFVTLGGALACDVHGKNHHRDGSFARHVEWFDLVTPAGEAVRVDPGQDLFWATAGGMGLTGVVTRLRLRLLAVRSASMRVVTERAPSLDALLERLAEHDARRYSVAWLDVLKTGAAAGRGVLISGEHADDGPGGLAFGPRPRATVPDAVPRGMLNTPVARAFNEAWYRRAPARPRTTTESIGAFFHPLDGVLEWNRLYGGAGFVQYQGVVPPDREDALRELLDRVRAAGVGAFLAVLKRFGEGRGPLSFPIPGWTLALDFPAGASGLIELFDDLDRVVADAGGRVYLAKDARVRGELLERMYPELDAWRAVQRGVDPDGVMQSDLARRLGLTG